MKNSIAVRRRGYGENMRILHKRSIIDARRIASRKSSKQQYKKFSLVTDRVKVGTKEMERIEKLPANYI